MNGNKRRYLKSIFKKFICTALIASMSLAMFGCGKSVGNSENIQVNKIANNVTSGNLAASYKPNAVESKKINDDFAKASMDFTVDLFKQAVANSDANGNVMVSGESMAFVMGMLANGADGQTKEEIEKALAGKMSIDEYNQFIKTYREYIESDSSNAVKMSNSIWINDLSFSSDVKEEFLQKDVDYYNAAVFREKFDESIVDKINNYVSDNTDGMIDKIADDSIKTASMALINTLAFDAKWERTYEESDIEENCDFTNSKGDIEKVTMLRSTENIFVTDGSAKGFIKKYKGDKYAYMAILPEEGVSANDYVASLSGSDFKKLYDNRDYKKEVHAMLPEYTYRYNCNAMGMLMEMGVNEAFRPTADFSGISDDELFVDQLIQSTYISVDRNGTKAAAITMATLSKGAMESDADAEYVILDRPFVYAIVDTENGIPLFIGTVNQIN